MAILEARHLRKSFGPFVAVDDVSFTLESGRLLGLLGPNGAGKTTTVSMATGLLPPGRGGPRFNLETVFLALTGRSLRD